ncbi:hypothetical protein [Actinomadura vinacea]|uniref:hypothetical protein n=1 Tax=Actinomadura vinacea TaxID=115336 RepID=UPI0031E05286
MQRSESLVADVRAALAAEAVAVQRYTYFAQVAEIEGHTEIAVLFADLAQSIGCVAHGHLDVLGDTADTADAGRDVGETRLNLATSVAGAMKDAHEGYPGLASAAYGEGRTDVASWLTTLAALKKAHVAKLDAALRDLAAPTSAILNGAPGTEETSD